MDCWNVGRGVWHMYVYIYPTVIVQIRKEVSLCCHSVKIDLIIIWLRQSDCCRTNKMRQNLFMFIVLRSPVTKSGSRHTKVAAAIVELTIPVLAFLVLKPSLILCSILYLILSVIAYIWSLQDVTRYKASDYDLSIPSYKYFFFQRHSTYTYKIIKP